jgi:hypothetical protein
MSSEDEGGELSVGGEAPSQPHDGELQKVEKEGKRALHEVVHQWIPLGIAIASVFAAVMGWRASLADESSAHSEELSRQNLIQQQQSLVQDNNAVAADVGTFGDFAQSSALAHSLLADADRIGGRVGDQLRTEGQADLGIARYLGKQIALQNYAFDPSSPNSNPNLRTDGTYQPGHPYDASAALAAAENADFALHGLAPEQLHATAESEHTRGVDFTGIAALFVGVMVLLTFGAIVSGPPKLVFAASGGAITLLGVILFLIVQLGS